MPEKEISWIAPEYRYYEKSASWYWMSALIAAALLVFFVWQKNILFSAFIIIAEILLIAWGQRQPQKINFKIDSKNITIGIYKTIPYEAVKGFDIREDDGDFGELILQMKSVVNPYVKILVFNKEIPEIKDFLKEKIKEIEYIDSISDTLSRKIKF
ncbi:MAG: hypothetical protein PHP03_00810 [Candidatus Pacebacteria bacterium]|nr:hypothetical protein [Candidatus Paceibacterota bacterium]